MNAADRRQLTPVLGIVAAVLALLLIALWLGLGRSPRWHDDAQPPRLPTQGAAPPAPAVPPLQQFAQVWQQPLFSPTRTPSATGGADAQSGDLQLTGVILLPDLKLAIVHDTSSGADYRIRQGQPSNGGPALVKLEPRSAVVDAGGSRVSLQLVPGPAPAAGDAAATPDSANVAVPHEGGAGTPVRMDGAQSAEARARALKARIDARRREAAQRQGNGG